MSKDKKKSKYTSLFNKNINPSKSVRIRQIRKLKDTNIVLKRRTHGPYTIST